MSGFIRKRRLNNRETKMPEKLQIKESEDF